MIRKTCLLLLVCCMSTAARAEMPAIDLGVGMYRIRAEVAHTQEKRMIGLMHRRYMAADAGMLFVFPEAQAHCMWMRNTLLPLSVAFIDAKGVIINIEDMQPQNDTAHCAVRPARYALETNTGWFAARKLTTGARITGLERVPAPE
jgi:uncharacterized membrane protein (UPF0127 family)